MNYKTVLFMILRDITVHAYRPRTIIVHRFLGFQASPKLEVIQCLLSAIHSYSNIFRTLTHYES